MKRKLFSKRWFVSLFLTLMTTFSWAYDFEVDGICYNINSDGTSVTVTYKGTGDKYSGAVVIPETVTYDSKNYSVTSIGWGAFSYSGLTSVTIGNSVTSIGNGAFYECSGLTSVTIGNSVTSIGDDAFRGCSALTSIAIPNSVTSIGKYTFFGCSGLTSINIPNGVTSISESAFSYSGLTSINIPNSVTSIGIRAFFGCSGLTSINIPNSVTSIGQYAFVDCSGLTSITIPNSMTSIGDDAFYGCSSLTSVTINSNAITSKYYSGDKNIKNIFGEQVKEYVIGNDVTSIGDYAFSSCSGLTSLTIGSGVKTFGQDAFYGINKLFSLTILCQNAGSWFKGVTTLKDLMLGNGVESIADEAFSGCSDLATISIGSGIKTIGAKAFANCRSINDVYCYAIRYPITPADAFENSYPDYITLHVSDESVDNYKAVAPWSTFKKVVGLSSDSGREACEKPVITYKDGKLEATSETEGAQCVIIISDEDVNTHFNSVNLTATYHISAYATKPNYKNSEIVTATLCWIDQEPETEGLINDVAEVRALPVLIQSEGGVISVNGVNSGTEVRVYAVNGTMAGSANATDNSAQIDTNLLPGSIAIVKIGKKSVKIVMK